MSTQRAIHTASTSTSTLRHHRRNLVRRVGWALASRLRVDATSAGLSCAKTLAFAAPGGGMPKRIPPYGFALFRFTLLCIGFNVGFLFTTTTAAAGSAPTQVLLGEVVVLIDCLAEPGGSLSDCHVVSNTGNDAVADKVVAWVSKTKMRPALHDGKPAAHRHSFRITLKPPAD